MGSPAWEDWEGKKVKIGFIGNYQSGYVGEVSDETHLVREMESLGHQVYKIPRDEWREYVIEKFPIGKYPNIPENIHFDIIIIAKWPHFYDGSFIQEARSKYKCPVFLWVWDYMWDQGIPEWHLNMVNASDLYLGNDVRSGQYPVEVKDKLYYFPFDVADGEITQSLAEKDIDVAFFGSCIGQGDRIEWLTEINKTNPVTVFAWNHLDWAGRGFQAYPAVYGKDFARVSRQSKIILGFSVEPNCWGYWSNRVGKILTLGGFLLYQYAPGMELFLRDGAEYFSSIEEAREKIDHYLIADDEREKIAARGYQIGRDRFTSKERVKDLMILAERYIRTGGVGWQL